MGRSIEDAISTMRWGLATKRATGAEIKVPYYLGLLAEAHRRANRIADGMSLLHEALELVEQLTNGGTRRSCIGSWLRR